MAKQLQENPWLNIWVEPRKTMRAIVNTDPKYGFLLLSAVYGLPLAFNVAQSMSLIASIPLWAVIISSLVVCIFLGMIGISICAWLLHITGKWIGGKGSFQTIRSAVAWSNVPNFVTILMWIVLMVVFGGNVFNRDFAETPFIGYQAGIVFLVFLIQTIVSIWGFILLLKCLGEVQGFSAWRALGNVLIPSVIIVGIIWVLGWLATGAGTINH